MDNLTARRTLCGHFVERLGPIPPLPKGEGRGEGKAANDHPLPGHHPLPKQLTA
jgi:hypothetical protein